MRQYFIELIAQERSNYESFEKWKKLQQNKLEILWNVQNEKYQKQVIDFMDNLQVEIDVIIYLELQLSHATEIIEFKANPKRENTKISQKDESSNTIDPKQGREILNHLATLKVRVSFLTIFQA